MIKNKNKNVGLINIISGVLGCITCFIFLGCMEMDNKPYIYFTNKQADTTFILAIMMALPFIFTFIINLIYIFKNWHNKKSMFMNILTIVSIITTIVLIFIFETYSYLYIIAIIAVWGILLLVFNKNEEENNKSKILVGIMILNIILFVISSIGFLIIKSDFEIKYVNNEKNLVKSIMELSSGSDVAPIKVKKEGKIGYIDSNGNIIIDFIYDDGSEFIEIEDSNNNKKYYVAVVSVGNEARLITSNNKQIVCYKNRKMSKVKTSDFSYSLNNEIEDNAYSLSKKMNLNKYIKVNTLEAKSLSSYYYSEQENKKYNSNYDFSYEEDSLLFGVPNKTGETLELTYNTKTKSVTYNGRKVSIDGNLYIYKDESGRDYIDTYQNGYIPIYNFEKELFGWIDLKGQTHYIKGKKQILDFSDKYIAVKDYSIKGDEKVYVMDYQENRVSDFYKEITVLDKGYVVKKQNGKNAYLDENFKQITKEYDIIDTCRARDGILIVQNLNNKKYGTYDASYNLDNIKFDLINVNKGKVIGTDFEYISGMDEFKYNINSSHYNSDNELICSVDCDYLNTKLYDIYQ